MSNPQTATHDQKLYVELARARDAVCSVILEILGRDPIIAQQVQKLQRQNPKSAQSQEGMTQIIGRAYTQAASNPELRAKLTEATNSYYWAVNNVITPNLSPNAEAFLSSAPSRPSQAMILANKRDLIRENLYEAYFKHDPELQRIHKELFGETNMIREAIYITRGLRPADMERRIAAAVQKETARIEFATAVLEKATELGGPSPETIKEAYTILKENAEKYGFYGQWLNRDYSSFYVSERQLGAYEQFRQEVLNKAQPLPTGPGLSEWFGDIIAKSGAARQGVTDIRWENRYAGNSDFRQGNSEPKFIDEPRLSAPAQNDTKPFRLIRT